MKKIFVLLVVLLVTFSVSGCNFFATQTDADPTPTNPPLTTEKPAQAQKITEDKAIEIASQYWGIKSGDVDELTGYSFLIMPVESSNDNIKIALKWLVNNEHYSTVDTIEIDSVTGEVLKGSIQE